MRFVVFLRKGCRKQTIRVLHSKSVSQEVINRLNACVRRGSLTEGRLIHADIEGSEMKLDNIMGTALVSMYVKCGSLEDAQGMFDKLPNRDVVSWNAIIAGYSRNCLSKEAIYLLLQMIEEGLKPNRNTFISILNAFASPVALSDGELVHAFIVNTGLDSDVVIATALVSMYGKCAKLEEARNIFNRIPQRNMITWTTMISAYAYHGQSMKSLEVFREMQEAGIKVDKVTIVSVLNACSKPVALAEGKKIHAHIVAMGIQLDVVIGTTLVTMYSKCGSLEDACQVYKRTPENNVVSCTAMLTAYAQHGYPNEALKLFQQMYQEDAKPNKVTFISILAACVGLEFLRQGKLIHTQIVDIGIESDVVVGTALISMYSNCGSVRNAQCIFDQMFTRNTPSWNAMITAYAQHDYGKEAFQLLKQMQTEDVEPDKVTIISILNACTNAADLVHGKMIHVFVREIGIGSDVVIGNALISMYAKCGGIIDTHSMFNAMPQRDVVTWNLMIVAYGQSQTGKEVLSLFHEMKSEGILPDKITFTILLNVCSLHTDLDKGKNMHTYVVDSGLHLDSFVGTSLINMYSKCGSIEDACRVFDRLQVKEMITWTAMIVGHAYHGNGNEAVQLFEQMLHRGIKPDSITLSGVLCACSHAGFVDEGYLYFNSMTKGHAITPTVEHYLCMIDLVSRVGQLDNAEEFIQRMPFKASVEAWMIVLGACSIHSNVELGQSAAGHILELEPKNTVAYVLLSNIYAAAGRWVDYLKLRQVMANKAF